MALSNALFAGLSGLDANQVKLNVVGNNIANANTVAFKSSRVLFKPQFYVTDSGGSQPNGDVGGTNPSQRGLGVDIAALERDFSPGSLETTGKSTDMAIDGAGFFILRSDEVKYTRDGTFTLNGANQLVTRSGDFVQGYVADMQNFTLKTDQLRDLTIPLGTASTSQVTRNTTLEGNLNASGALAGGASVLASQSVMLLSGGTPDATSALTDVVDANDPSTPMFTEGDVITFGGQKGGRDLPASTFTVQAESTLGDFAAFLRQGMGINDTVAPSADPSVPQPGVTIESDPSDPYSAAIVIAGNIGSANALAAGPGSMTNQNGNAVLSFTDSTNEAGVASNPSGESVHTSFVAYDSRGTAVPIDVTAVLESSDNNGSTWRFFAESAGSTGGDPVVGSGTISFDNFGQFKNATGNTITINRAGTGAQPPMAVTLDFSTMTSLSSQNSEMVMTAQDGSPIGNLTGFSVGTDGLITGNFSNGMTRPLGQLVMATFSNTQGLVDRGGNTFVEGANSGPAVRGTPQSLGLGKVVSGALELSNVDLSAEFINLIVASTGFSASSRVITTSDQLLTELLNSSR